MSDHLQYMEKDGLNSLKYTVRGVQRKHLYTKILAQYDGPSALSQMESFIRDSVNPSLLNPELVGNPPTETSQPNMGEGNVGLSSDQQKLVQGIPNVFNIPQNLAFSRMFQKSKGFT